MVSVSISTISVCDVFAAESVVVVAVVSFSVSRSL